LVTLDEIESPEKLADANRCPMQINSRSANTAMDMMPQTRIGHISIPPF
jgi:hypothetical protein